MDNTNEIIVFKMFKECGLNLVKNNFSIAHPALPDEGDLFNYTSSKYKNMDENLKLETIKEYISTRNHFRVFDWNFFISPKYLNKKEKADLNYFFNTSTFLIENNELVLVYDHLFDSDLKYLMNNKNFINDMSKEFQVKTVFSSKDQALNILIEEFGRLIEKKVIELGVLQKYNIDLPRFILNNLTLSK